MHFDDESKLAVPTVDYEVTRTGHMACGRAIRRAKNHDTRSDDHRAGRRQIDHVGAPYALTAAGISAEAGSVLFGALGATTHRGFAD